MPDGCTLSAMFMLIGAFVLPLFVGSCVAALDVEDGTRSALVWLFVFPAIFVGGIAGAWLDNI